MNTLYLDQEQRLDNEETRSKLWDNVKNMIMACLAMVEGLAPLHAWLGQSLPPQDPHLHVLRHELAQFFIAIVQYSPSLELHTDLIQKIHDVYCLKALENFSAKSTHHTLTGIDELPDVDTIKRYEVEAVLCALVAKDRKSKNQNNPFLSNHSWLSQYRWIISA